MKNVLQYLKILTTDDWLIKNFDDELIAFKKITNQTEKTII